MAEWRSRLLIITRYIIIQYAGFIQEIGPYYMEEGVNYTVGDKLVPNPYSWHTVSNLLFL